MEKVGRNEPCPCGSGKKYKNCHMDLEATKSSRNQMLLYIVIFIAIITIAIVGAYLNSQGADQNAGKVWSEEHQHYH